MNNKKIRAGAIIAGMILLLYGSVSAYRTSYYSERNKIRSRLESIPNVEIVRISGDDHLTYFHTKFVDIRLKDHPNSFIGLEVPSLGILEESDHIFLAQIGPWILASQGQTRFGTMCMYGSIDIGSASLVADQLPITVRTIDGLISNYSQLEAFFAGRPEQKQEGESLRRDSKTVICHLPAECN